MTEASYSATPSEKESGDIVTQIVEEAKRSDRILLNLSHRGLRVIPQAISNLVSLRVLLLNNNGLIMPPTEIVNLKKLECLSLEHNQLTLLPSDISKLSLTLQFLNLSHNPLTYLPPSISQLENLRELWLSHIGLTSFPVEVCNLTKLELLSLEENAIPQLIEGLGNLSNLKWLSLAKNSLNSLRRDSEAAAVSPVTKLTHLVSLHLEENEFVVVPSEVFSPTLVLLTNVDLRKNCISSFDLADISGLFESSARQLAKLDLRDNRLDTEKIGGAEGIDFCIFF